MKAVLFIFAVALNLAPGSLSTTDATGRSIAYAYNLTTNTTTVTDRMGYVTSLAYDAYGNVTQKQRALLNANGTVNHYVTTTSTFADTNNPQKPTKAIDPLGRETDYTYDPSTGATDTMARWYTPASGDAAVALTTTSHYNAYNQILTQTEPLTLAAGDSSVGAYLTTISNTYDGYGDLIATTDADGNATDYSYNPDGTVHTTTDAVGSASGASSATVAAHTTTYGYDSFGDVNAVFDGNNHETQFGYDIMGNKTSQTTTRTDAITGGQDTLLTQFYYDDEDRLIQTMTPDGTTNQTIYNDTDQIGETIDGMGRPTTYAYDGNGRAAQIVMPGGRTEEMTYDYNGNKLTETDSAGHVMAYVYDSLNRQIAANAYGTGSTVLQSSSETLDLDGETTGSTDGNSNTTTNVYDDLGRITDTYDAVGGGQASGAVPIKHTVYDLVGRQLSTADGDGNVTSYVYDSDGHVLSSSFADDSTEAMQYDALGNRIKSTDQDGLTTQFAYDNLNRETSVATPLGLAAGYQTESYSFDEIGEKTGETDADGNVTKFGHDLDGHVNQEVLPAGQIAYHTFDTAGYPLSDTDFNSNTVFMRYDSTARLTAKLEGGSAGAALETFSYNPDDTTASETKGNVTTTDTYDALGRLISVSTSNAGAGGITMTVAYTYDEAGNKKSQTTDTGTLTYDYDADERLSAVHFSTAGVDETSPTLIATYSYDNAGNLTSMTTANGVTTKYSYDALNRLLNETSTTASATVNSCAYNLYPDGKRESVTDQTGATTTYLYDNDGRLYDENGPYAGHIQYQYDRAGNRMYQWVNGAQTQAYTYDGDNRIATLQSGTETPISFGKDSNGNVLSDMSNAYTFDWENKLVSSTPLAEGSTETNYVYDAEGERVQESTGSQVTNYTVDPRIPLGATVEESLSNGTVARTDYSDLGPIRYSTGGSSYYFVADGAGSTRQITDSSGNVLSTFAYDAFGNLTSGSGQPSAANDLLYDGQSFDPASGDYYLRARFMNPQTGTLLGRDPMDGTIDLPLSMHKYAYAWDDPVNLADPSGKDIGDLGLDIGVSIDTAASVASIGTLFYTIGQAIVTGYGDTYFGSELSAIAASYHHYPDVSLAMARTVGAVADQWCLMQSTVAGQFMEWRMSKDLYIPATEAEDWDIIDLRGVGGATADNDWIDGYTSPPLKAGQYDARMVVVDGQTFHSYSANYVLWGEANELSGWPWWLMMDVLKARKFLTLWGKDVTGAADWANAGYRGWPGFPTPFSTICSLAPPTANPELNWEVVWEPKWSEDSPPPLYVDLPFPPKE